ncbi:MAG TPA: hypothetical protein VM243_00025 [Phycisphaerae bacterium]|nr:hypothetical protein [Phycisphaerae bacterium]
MCSALGLRPVAAIVMVAGILTTTPTYASVVYRLEIFTDNGAYHDDPDVLLLVAVSEESGLARFDVSNESTIPCVISGVYFEQGLLESLDSLIDGPGTSFSWPAHPRRLPAGQMLDPPFVNWFSAGAGSPAPTNGINPDETLTLRFNLAQGVGMDEVYGHFNSAEYRIGAHLIALPDGSSESASTMPEPTTLALLLGPAMVALGWRPGKRRR